MSRWSKRFFILAAALLAIGGLMLPLPSSGQAKGERVIFMAAVEPKGGVTVDKEPHPASPLPTGGGYVLKAPDPSGRWEVSAYQWSPATIVVQQGDRVTLEIVGINGAKHTGTIERYATTPFTVKRGQLTRVSFTADAPGVFRIYCDEHKPTMEGTLVVLPR
ncbi:MAG: cupredoxin domain-containing protein [candidate division NC10 bacterium]|nr:cupredoxin domain-containing protein [candidate division NC10 bacterium]MBI3002855.1 cupredoxin domain-containing protein [candidate division NC10 bacterium]MBI4391790.1 cupredoxin domain-containing protein [candidate division NC10 bacterium]